MGTIQEIYKSNYNPKILKIRFSQKLVQDISNPEHQLEEIKKMNNFAHRNDNENSQQILQNLFFPKLQN